MIDYLRGTDVLGAISQLDAENIVLTQRAEKHVLAGIGLGAAVATIGLASAWKSHRILGGLLGFLIVGPVAGGGLGLLYSHKDVKKIAENLAKQETLRSGARPEKTS